MNKSIKILFLLTSTCDWFESQTDLNASLSNSPKREKKPWVIFFVLFYNSLGDIDSLPLAVLHVWMKALVMAQPLYRLNN